MPFFNRLLLILLLFVLSAAPLLAQQKPVAPFCGTPPLTDNQRRQLDREARFALTMKRERLSDAATTLTYVPIRPHIFRTSAGTGGMNLAKLNRIVAVMNRYYLLNGFGIQFYLAGASPDYIDNDTHYNAFEPDNEDAIVAGRDATNALNLYIVNAFSEQGLGGYAYLPANALYSTRVFVLNQADEVDLGNRLLPHELGHTFSLYHTFEGSTGPNPELVTRGAGANCTTAGDLLCDTPADPYDRPGATVGNVNGCQQYTGTATDPQGNAYAPSISNIMSYYFPCTHNFTLGQYDRIDAGLAFRQTHTAYSLNYPPATVTAPANLSAALSNNRKSVTLTWQDLATNELGYFVERSTRPDGGFGAIGGLGPGGATYTDASVQGNTTYYYRIKPSNTTTGSLSPTIAVNVPVCRPTYASSCSTTNGLSRVVLNGNVLSSGSGCAVAGHSSLPGTATVSAGQTIPLLVTLLNATTALFTAVWADLDRDGTYETNELLIRTESGNAAPTLFSLTLPASLTSGTLPLRVLTATTLPTDPCGHYSGGETEDYLLTVGTSVTCPVPGGLTATTVGGTSASLSWIVANGASSFGVQYRVSGSGSWSLVSGVASTTYALTGLVPGTSYQWQVLSNCGVAGSSALSAMGTFTTVCSAPTGLSTTAINGNSAVVSWQQTNATYTLQYRPAGSPAWTTVSGLSTNLYTLTSLTVTTPYEWRVATGCPGGVTSGYAGPVSFTTTTQLAYCQPNSPSGCSDGDGLADFRLGTWQLSQNSGCGEGGYQSFSAIGASLTPGQAYSFVATFLSNSWAEGLALWIDLNQNGTFETAERLYASATPATGTISGSLTIPASTTTGTYRMRLRAAYNDTPIDPCVPVEYGETEDYWLGIMTPPPPSADLSLAMATSSRTPSIGEVVGVTLTVTNAGPQSVSGVMLTSLLPPNMTFVGSTQTAVTSSGGAVSVAVGTLPVQLSGTYWFTVRVTQPGTYWLAAQVAAVSLPDLDSFVNSGTSDGDDDMAVVDLRTRETGIGTFVSPNPSPRSLPSVVGNQPLPATNEADLSLALQAATRTIKVGDTVSLSAVVSNRGSLTATGVSVQLTLPAGWAVANTAGLTANGQNVTATVVNVPPNQSVTVVVPVLVSGVGEQAVLACITAANQADLDSPHSNSYGQGEDDEAMTSVRVR